MKRIKTTIGTIFIFAGAAFAGEWQRNTFPSTKHVEAGFAPGKGWSHTEAVMDISVSPADPNFRAMIDNEWTMVYTEDGLNYKPLRMPHIGTAGCSAQSVEFSPHDPNIMYLVVAHNHWSNMEPTASPAGLWRGTRSPGQEMTWEHLYQPPAGGYENPGNNPGRTRILEDPASRPNFNHIYLATTSDGLKRSTNGGATWQDVVPELNNHRIKTVEAATNSNNVTYLYVIAEKKMPRHVAGEAVPVAFWAAPSNFDVQWKFNNDLLDSKGNGNPLTGSVADWTKSTIEGTHAAKFNNSSSLTSTNPIYNNSLNRLSVSAWVQTTSNADQSIISFSPNEYWELGTRNGSVLWTVRNPNGTVTEVLGTGRIDDGDWHHVGATFTNGTMRLFVDGKQVGLGSTAQNTCGSNNPASAVVGANFTGALDDVRIYSALNMNAEHAQRLYLEDEHKNPIPQGQLWRVRVNASGNITETVRLHAPLADFHDVEVNPHNPSRGWVIRKAIPFDFPYGGRELYEFSNYGNTLTPSTAALGGNIDYATFDVVMVNPGNTNHVFLAHGGQKRTALRWSMDGGATWKGMDRNVGGFIPSINSWLPMDYQTFGTGIKTEGSFLHRGSPFAFVPGEPEKLLWIDQTMGGLLQSDDYGATWRTYATGGPNKDLGQIAVAPSNPDHWAVGLYEHGWSVTTNGGLSWYAETHHNNDLLELLGNEAAADPKVGWTASRVGAGVAFHPTKPNIMVATWSQRGYILRSTDAGKNWTYTGYRDSSYEHVDVYWSRTNASRVYAGRMRSDDAGMTWVENGNGIDPGKIVIAVSDSDSDRIVGVDNMQTDVTAASLNMHVSTNGGDSWTSLPDPPREMVSGTSNQWLVTGTSRKWNTMADALVAIDPGASSMRILLAGRSGIYEYNEGSNDWILHNTGLQNNPHSSMIENEQVPWMGFVAFDPRPGYSHIVYAASQNDEATMGAWAGPANPNRAYPGGENSDPYYRSTDGGLTWEHLHGDNYPDAPGGGQIESMLVDSRGRMFAATTEGVYIFSNRTPVFTPGLNVNFTNGSYPDGRLDGNVRWNGGGTSWVVTEPVGLVVDDTAADSKLQNTTAINATEMTVGAVLRFSESGAAPSTDWRMLLEIGLTGSEDLNLKLVRRNGIASEYQLVFTRGSDLGGGFNSGKKDGSLLGLNLAGGDADSDRLYLTYTITRGTQASDTWKATTRLYNLDTDPGMSQPIISQNNLAVDPADVLWGEGLYPYMNSGQNNASGNMTGLTIESFTANPEPASASAPIVRAGAIEGSAYIESLVGSATDPDPADRLSYAKITGPAWLSMAANGALSGTPTSADVGLNSFTVEVSDGNGGTDSATLEITVAGQPLGPYAQWASDHGVGAMDEDFDKDGLDNLTEYALGGNPTNASDVGLLPTYLKTDDGWHYVYRRHLDPAAAGLVYTVETTTNLASGEWTDTGTVEIDTEVIDSEFESVINAVDTTDKPELFIRLKIEAD